MKESLLNYKLDKLTGPSGVFAGYVLLAAGIITIYFSLTAVFLILLGGLMAFTYQGTQIDQSGKRYRSIIVIAGFYPMGKWIDFIKTDEIHVRKISGKYVVFSRSNRQLDIPQTDFRVILLPTVGKKELHLAKFQSETEARKLAADLEALLLRIEQKDCTDC
jgi:hypothetical protein